MNLFDHHEVYTANVLRNKKDILEHIRRYLLEKRSVIVSESDNAITARGPFWATRYNKMAYIKNVEFKVNDSSETPVIEVSYNTLTHWVFLTLAVIFLIFIAIILKRQYINNAPLVITVMILSFPISLWSANMKASNALKEALANI